MTPADVLANVFSLLVPEIILLAAACVLFVAGTFATSRSLWGAFTLLALVAAGVAVALNPLSPMDDDSVRTAVFVGPVYVDRLAILLKWIALIGTAVLVLAGWDEASPVHAPEYHACLLLIAAGMCLVGESNDLVTLFLSLELISIPTYVLLYLPRHDSAGQEAAMKYFMLSIFSSALMLFGFSYVYGLGGTTNLPALAEAMSRAGKDALPGIGVVALVLIVAGLGFRITAVPFHFYAPDVYQGTATSNASLLAFVPKVAGFVALLRILGYIPHEFLRGDVTDLLEGTGVPDLVLGSQVPRLLWILAVVTMSLGNVLALLQDNVKRMLAYSSVAHAGYMLIGLVVARFLPVGSAGSNPGGVDAVLFYLISYGAMTIGAFTVLVCLSTPTRPVETVDDLAGLARSHPLVAILMAIFLFSLIGMPLTAGFVGKFLIFWGAMSVLPDSTDPLWFRVLALIGVINAAIGAWYYLRIVTVMYLRTPLKALEPVRWRPALAALVVCAALTLVGGIYPNAILEPIQAALPHAPKPAGVAAR